MASSPFQVGMAAAAARLQLSTQHMGPFSAQGRCPSLPTVTSARVRAAASPGRAGSDHRTCGGEEMGLAEFAGWLATQVFDVVGSFDGVDGGQNAGGSATVDLQVGKAVFHDVPAQMRSELWLSQLQRKGPRGGAPTAGEYYDLLFETLPAEVLSDIDKDTHRTFPGHPRLSTPEGHRSLLNVLSAYALSDPEIGYTQGMNFLAGVLLTWLPSEADAFAALSLLMRQRGLREMYLPDMSLLQIRLWQLSKLLPPRLAAHLEAHAVLPVLWASSWLLTCFAADFPLHFAGRVMDVLLTQEHQVASPILKIAVAIVQRCEADLMRKRDFEEMVHHLRQEVPQWSKTQLQELLSDALSKPWSARQLRILDQINGAETVMEAVSRVNGLATQASPEPAAKMVAAAAGPLEPAGSSSRTGAGTDAGAGAAASAPALPAAAAAVSSAVAAASNAGRQQQQQDGSAAQPITPRSIAKSLSSGGLAAAGAAGSSSSAESAVWDPFHTAGLQSLATQKVRIECSIGDLDLLDLDPQLSQALSCYAAQYAPGAAAAAATAAAAAAGSGQPSPRLPSAAGARHAAQQKQQRQQQEQQPQAAAAAGGGSAASPQASARQALGEALSGDLTPSLMASPFESLQPTSASTKRTADDGSSSGTAGVGGRGGTVPAPGPAAAPRGEQQHALAGAASSYGSFQLGTFQSAHPLVPHKQQQQQQGQQLSGERSGGSAESGGPSPVHGLFGLFRRGDGPGQQQQQRSGDSTGASAGAGSNDLRDAPSSTGSSLASLAAVLQKLGLQEEEGTATSLDRCSGGSGGAAVGGAGRARPASAGAAVAGPERQLRHSNDLEGLGSFGSFKTAQGGSGGPARTASDASWHSASATGGAGLAQRDSSTLSSTASSGVRTAEAAAAAAVAAGAAGSVVLQQRSPRLSSDEASQRASSLQEQHLLGFLSSGKKDAAGQEK